MIRKAGYIAALIGLFMLWVFSDRLLPPQEIRAERVHATDGDTLTLDAKVYRIQGIDAPEYRQTCKDAKGLDWPCGKAARAQLVALVTPGSLVCQPQAQDKYGRSVVRCSSATVPDIGAAMVQAGLAINFGGFADGPYIDEESEARQAKRGIWQGEFDRPEDWRAAHPRSSLLSP